MYFLFLLSFVPVIIEFFRVINYFKYKRGQRPQAPFMTQYPIFIIVAIIAMSYLLYNNYIFLNFVGAYRVQSYPDSTLYCHVSLYNDVTDVIYPCEVVKESSENGTYYYLNTICMPNGDIDLSNNDIQLYPDKYDKELLSDENGQHYEVKIKLVNIKYKPTKDINKSDEIWEYTDLLLAALNLIYVLDCFFTLMNREKMLSKYDKYFADRYGHLKNQKTNEKISDVQSYIDALQAQEEINN